MSEKTRPKIIAVCGSTRFIEQIAIIAWTIEKEGSIPLYPILLPPSYATGPHAAEAEGVKDKIDELFLRKIDLADELFVANLDGYIGESTRSEIKYAESLGKPVVYLESPKPTSNRLCTCAPGAGQADMYCPKHGEHAP